MRWRRFPWIAVAVVLLLSAVACRQATEETATDKPNKPSAEETVMPAEPAAEEPGNTTAAPEPPEPPPAPTMPEVKLTDALAETCLVKVGDTLPPGTLVDQNGQAVELASTFGPKLTVVYFWKGDSISNLQGLQRLEKHVAGPYAERGVNVVAINEKDTPQSVDENLKKTGVTFRCLLDTAGAYFATIATGETPRVYLLDVNGKILWLDTDYSLGTERNLTQAVDFVLSGE